MQQSQRNVIAVTLALGMEMEPWPVRLTMEEVAEEVEEIEVVDGVAEVVVELAAVDVRSSLTESSPVPSLTGSP